MNLQKRTSKTGQRTPFLCALGVLAAGIILGASSAPAQTNTDSTATFDSFKIITQRNIFDPNRSRIRVYDRPPTSHPSVENIALVGTMSYPKGKFAFFDGSSSQYKKVLEPGAGIAGYTVKEITPTAVTLAANGKEFEMKVGAELRNESGQGWRLSARSEPPAALEAGTTDAAPATPPAGASPEMNDVIKRLMQQRQQELK